MIYIKKCNPTGKQRLGLAIWFILCHYIHVIVVISLMVMTWFSFFLETFSDRSIDTSAYIMGLQLSYDDLLDLIFRFATLGVLPISLIGGFLIGLLSKTKLDLQTIEITRRENSNVCKSGAYNVFTSTKTSSPVRIRKNEVREFKVVKGNQKFWISQGWIPKYLIKSNELDIDVLDSKVELEVGCDENMNLWIREKEKPSDTKTPKY